MAHGRRETAVAPATQGHVLHWASIYDHWVSLMMLGQAPAIRRLTVEHAEIKAGDCVLDVGCGTGDLTLAAKAKADTVGRVVGIDPSPEMIEVARHKAAQLGTAVEFQVGVIETIPFPDDTFDVVLSSLMMHHLPDELKLRGLAEVRRVLKPEGRLLIVDFKRPTSFLSKSLIELLLHGGMRTGVQDLPRKLAKVGFYDIQVGDMNFPPLGYAGGRADK